MIEIAVINQATSVPDADAIAFVVAAQLQVSNDFYPVWGSDAQLTYVKKGDAPALGAWWLVLMDNADQAGALGYHELTNEGQPLGKVFVQTTIDAGDKWTVTASHELLEMLEDPYASIATEVQMGGKASAWIAWEVCDACEDDQYAYEINNLPMSDFVFPAWFEPWREAGPFDFCQKIGAPMQLLPGGYISELKVRGGGWQQITGDNEQRHQYDILPGSRRDRRRSKMRRLSTIKHGAVT